MRVLMTLVVAVLSMTIATPAHAGTKAAEQSLREFREGRKPYNVVQNRFFLKQNRFEIAPALGYVPNNPFVKRYVGGVMFAYHLTEQLAAEGTILYAPDLAEDDLKALTHTLVNIAQDTDDGDSFQQPLEKMTLGASFAARWAPVYGKINLIGEKVLNFDFYGTAGLGMLSLAEYYAVYDQGQVDNGLPPGLLQPPVNVSKVAVNLGLGMDFFLSNSVALKVDARSYLYSGKDRPYNSNIPATSSRMYNNFIASVGFAFFVPKMPERMRF